MAFPSLVAARYADSNGYQADYERYQWRWRDWVIDAFNKNMPYDQFTVEQLAGDLLPDATLSQRIATAFNRNHRGNSEGGIVPAEYAAEYVVDRVDTTSTVWVDEGIRLRTRKPIALNEWHHVALTYDGSRWANGVKISATRTSAAATSPTPPTRSRSRTPTGPRPMAPRKRRGRSSPVIRRAPS